MYFNYSAFLQYIQYIVSVRPLLRSAATGFLRNFAAYGSELAIESVGWSRCGLQFRIKTKQR